MKYAQRVPIIIAIILFPKNCAIHGTFSLTANAPVPTRMQKTGSKIGSKDTKKPGTF